MAERVTTLVTREQEHQTATSLYGSDTELRELFDAVKAVAPWANNKAAPMGNHEIALVVRKAVAMGLDPLNSHEVQIWKDKRGNVNFQTGYPLLVEWVRHFYGEHTEPRYHRLDEDELKAEGLQPQDIAYRVTFLMKKDILSLTALTDAGYDPREARAMLEVSGLGVATVQEYNGEYFAPAARSRSWKVQKRALVDAYRRKFGTPNRSEIEELRRVGGFDNLKPGDWEDGEGLNPGDAKALAESNAHWREHNEALATDPEYAEAHRERTVVAADALYGAVIDGEVMETDELVEMAKAKLGAVEGEPEPEPEPHWIDDQRVRAGFWSWCKGEGLKQADVYTALGVESVHGYTGTKDEAKQALVEYIARNRDGEQPDEGDPTRPF